MVAIVGRKKKDAARVNYNISRDVRSAVLREASLDGRNEIDTIEDLIKSGLLLRAMLKDGTVSYVEYSKRLPHILRLSEPPTESPLEPPLELTPLEPTIQPLPPE